MDSDHAHDYYGGRIRLTYVSFTQWLHSITQGQRVRCVNMPRDAKVVGAFPCTDRRHRDVMLWLSSPDFDPVPEGAVIPEYRLEFELHPDELVTPLPLGTL